MRLARDSGHIKEVLILPYRHWGMISKLAIDEQKADKIYCKVSKSINEYLSQASQR